MRYFLLAITVLFLLVGCGVEERVEDEIAALEDIHSTLQDSIITLDDQAGSNSDLQGVREQLQNIAVIVNELLERAELRADYEFLIYTRGWLVRVYDDIAEMRSYNADRNRRDEQRDDSETADSDDAASTAEERDRDRRTDAVRDNASDSFEDLDSTLGDDEP